MGIRTGRPNLASSLLLNGFLPLTTGTCLLVSMSPCHAQNGDDPLRGLRQQQRGERQNRFTQRASLNDVQNGFTRAFNERVQRNTTGIDSRRFDLDLSSTVRNIELGSKMFNGASSVTINAGGGQQTFSAGDQVTAAQYVAIQQVLSESPQSISLNEHGIASGGSFSLNQAAASRVNNLLIPQTVSAVNNFAANRSVNLSGDLTNLGSIYGMSTSNRVRSGIISADDINNSGKISTDLTGSNLSSRGTVKDVDLTLVAEHELNNSGSITSSGALTVATAYGAVDNSGAVSAQRGDLNVLAGNGNLNNSGAISALSGNLNIAASRITTDLTINGAGGSFDALRGNINIRDEVYTDSNDTTMSGGTYSTRDLNVYGGGGTITTYVDEIDGQLNTSGLAAHVLTSEGTLTLGSNCLTGDPTFANTAGDIIINGGVVAREDITILAAGNIVGTGNAYISTANSTGATGVPSTNITLVAGALVTNVGGINTPGIPTPGVGIGAGNQATVDLALGLGGNIDFSKSKFLGPLINTSSTLTGGGNQQENGGNVVLAARSTSTANGFVIFPETRQSIDTSSTYNNSGSVTIIAGNNSATTKTPAIKVGAIKTQADQVLGGADGNVLLFAAQPESTTGAPITYDEFGARVGAVNFETNPLNLIFSGSSIQFSGPILAGGANISANASGANGGLIQKGTGRLQGDIVTLTSGLGGIGGTSTKTRILTEANVLILNSTANVFVNNLGSVNLGNGATPGGLAGNLGIFDVSTTADGEGNGQIVVPNNGQIEAGIGLLSIINLTSSGTVSGTGGIRVDKTASLNATTVNLADVNPSDGKIGGGFGDIGTGAGNNAVHVDATFVSAKTKGNVFIQSDGEISVLDSTAGNGKTFDVRTLPDGATGNGSITLLGEIKSEFGRIGTILLQSSENGAGTGGIIPGGTLVADLVRLRDDDGLGNLGNASIGTEDDPIVVDTSSLNVDTQGPEINIENVIKTGMELQGVNATGTRSGTFTLTSASLVHTSGTVFADTTITINTTAGGVILGGDLDVNTVGGTVFINSAGHITREGGNNEIIAPNVVLTSKSGGAGTDVLPLLLENVTGTTTNLTSNVTGYTHIYDQSGLATILLATTAKNQFTLASDGPLTINGTILSATGIKLETTGTTAADQITINANVGSSKTTAVLDIDTAGVGDIVTAPPVVLGASQLIDLATGGGDIGGIASPIVVLTPGLAANTDGAPGIVNLSAQPSKKVPLTLFNSGSEGNFVLNAQGSVVLNNIQTVNGSITVKTTAGTLSTNTNAIIQVAEAGNPAAGAEKIILQNSATKTSKKAAAIFIGAGTQISTFVATPGAGLNGAGAIQILAIPETQTPVQLNTTFPTNVIPGTQTGGLTYFGANSITANIQPVTNAVNIVDNINADITFDTGTKPATAIVLGGGVLIHADPPAMTGSTPVRVFETPSPTVMETSSAPQTVPQVMTNGLATQPRSISPSLVSSAPPLTNNQSFNNGIVQPSYEASSSSTDSLTNFATIAAELNNANTSINFCSTQKDGWISETELANGDIPAKIFGDITVSGDAAARSELEYPAPSVVTKLNLDQPLAGAVSTTVGVPRKEASLNRGTILAVPSTDTLINTPVGQIKIGAKSLALVMAFANGLAVYDLDDVRKGAIEVVAGGQSITMSPGQHIFITRSNAQSFDEVNPAQMIGYRSITSRDLNYGLRLFSAEFSVPHTCHVVQPLKHLLQSKHPHDRKVANHLLKTTAVTMQLRGRNGDFQQVFRPRKTAWTQ